MNEKNDMTTRLRQVKALEEDLREYRSIQAERAWQQTWARCTQQKPVQPQRSWTAYLMRVAAILVLPLLVSTTLLGYLYYERLQGEEFISYVETSAAPGMITRVTLPDSSTVWLNASSRLRYPAQFTSDTRRVELEGEGYFEVQADPQHPFAVTIPQGMTVQALGTRFNVWAYADDPQVKTTLASGSVEVKVGSKQVKLKPEEQAAYDPVARKMWIDQVEVEEAIAWHEGRLVFRNAPLEEIVRKLSRRYNVDLVVHQNSPKRYTFRANFSTESITQILDYLGEAAPIRWAYAPVKQNGDYSYPRQRIDIWVK